MSRASNTFVLSITHLKDRPNEKHALELLKKVVSLVKPIMRKHGWVLPELAEFFPGQQNLLDVNGGQKIMLRLRPHHSPTWFFEEEEIIGTMLHELTHNVHGPHDDKFYKFLSSLQDEYDELQRKGYSGEGFFTPGQRLGGSTHNPALHVGRLKALEAAEKRRQVSRVLGEGNPRRLGGGGTMSPRELAAQAAERRMRDGKECGSQQNSDLIQRESEKASREGTKNAVISLTGMDDDLWEPDWNSDDDDEVIIVRDVHPAPPRASGSGRAVSDPYPRPGSGSRQNPSSSAKAARLPKQGPSSSSSNEWECQICTLVNKPIALECDACGIRRPPDESTGWDCLACGEMGMPHEFWTCRQCGTVKVSS
ncbi:WLM domain-containing protein [Ephemerocybe angulata]|uniref:WLM domain-containing protein n=1 Tax=Ephemerocybe angulata TaxID=980116 RepID=A0A8H6HXW1_9AGAR|nr:WLM domain-containing protein [Tulosesus angulatus]